VERTKKKNALKHNLLQGEAPSLHQGKRKNRIKQKESRLEEKKRRKMVFLPKKYHDASLP